MKNGDVEAMIKYGNRLREQIQYCQYQKCLKSFKSHEYCQNTGAFFVWVKIHASKYRQNINCNANDLANI